MKKNLLQRLRSKSKHKESEDDQEEKPKILRFQSADCRKPIVEEDVDPLDFDTEVKVDTSAFDNFKKDIQSLLFSAITKATPKDPNDQNPEEAKKAENKPRQSKLKPAGFAMPHGKNLFAEILKSRVKLKAVDENSKPTVSKEDKKDQVQFDSDDSLSDIERKIKEKEEEKKRKEDEEFQKKLEEGLKSFSTYTPEQKEKFRYRIRHNLKNTTFPFYYGMKYNSSEKTKIMEKGEKLKKKPNFPKFLEKKVNEILSNFLPNPCVTDEINQILTDEIISEIKYQNIIQLSNEEILSFFK